MAHYVKFFMQYLIPLQLPIRGAIAFGDIFLNEKTSIFLGGGYLKAVELEKKQQWIGVSIDKSIEKEFPDFFKENNLVPFQFSFDRLTPFHKSDVIFP